MAKHQPMFWSYLGPKPRRDYIDPRIPVARQVGWQKLAGETPYSIPEPDNYNRAVLTDHPVECLAVEDQVIYKDISKNGWITVLYVPEEQHDEYDQWLTTINLRAYWQHTKPPKLKNRRSILL